MSQHYDALIVGGGPAGSTASLCLARAGWSVALCERQPMPRRKVCGEYLSATNLPLLDVLGVGEIFRANAGPPVRRVGLFAGQTCLEAALPAPAESGGEYGRALSRERLDPLLLERARSEGAQILQPCSIIAYEPVTDGFRFHAKDLTTGTTTEITAGLTIAAHGSWNPGTLPSQPPRRSPAPNDLIGFKAHFSASRLPEGLMPLLSFEGGYGGMVHEDNGLTSISCCVRRDRLVKLRAKNSGEAGDAVEVYLREVCRGVGEALAGAKRLGNWLSAGPIEPGIRLRHPPGVFPVGNAAGEAHPVVAEGISMAMQSAWLLADRLIAWRRSGDLRDELATIGQKYAADWRRQFASRLRASRVIAAWAMRPAAVSASIPLIKLCPRLLSLGALWSGKSTFAVTRTTIAAADSTRLT